MRSLELLKLIDHVIQSIQKFINCETGSIGAAQIWFINWLIDFLLEQLKFYLFID
jgi:hypothetical protein